MKLRGKIKLYFLFLHVLPQTVYYMQSSVVFTRFLSFCDATASSVFWGLPLLRLRMMMWAKFMLHMVNIFRIYLVEQCFNFYQKGQQILLSHESHEGVSFARNTNNQEMIFLCTTSKHKSLCLV